MQKQYDVIVIGAGNGGLAAAVTCARAGLSTLLLERHNLPGGAASSFVRGRFEFEPSLHELTTAEASGGCQQLFEEIGAKVDWVDERSTYRLVVPADPGEEGAFQNENGAWVRLDARMPVGYEAFARKLDELVPGSYKSARAAFDLARRMDTMIAELENDPLHGVRDALSFAPDLMRMTSHTVKDVLDQLGMPEKAQGIFTAYWCYLGIPASRLDFLYYMAMMGGYVKGGAAMPRLRSHEMSLALDRKIRESGGDIWYNAEVTEVLMRGGKPCGVVVNGEKRVCGKRFICNAFPNVVFTDLMKEKDIPKQQLRMTNAREIAASLSAVYLGMNKTAEELGIRDYSVFVAPDVDSDRQAALCTEFGSGFCIINCLNTVIPDCTPPGTCSLFLTGMTYGDVMRGVAPQDYKKFKNKVAKDMIETCERALGISITPYIEEIEVALPPTFARYLNTPHGTPYGYRLDLWDSMIPRTMHYKQDQPFDNFLFCGATQERGDGYGCAYHTGRKAANITIQALKGGK